MSFTFNSLNCESLGIYVERYPDRQIPAKKFTTYDVPGRSGRIYVPQGINAFENVTQSYEVFVKDKTTLQQKLSEIAKWLLDPNEPAELRDSYDSSVYRLGMFLGGDDWANSLNQYGKATLSFDCGPQRYDYPQTNDTFTIGSGVSGGSLIGTGSPKGHGYIDDPSPKIMLRCDTGFSVGDVATIDVTDTITSETTRIKIVCTTAVTNTEINIDTGSGTIWLKNTINGSTSDMETAFAVTVTGELQRRFTYQVQIDVQNESPQTLKCSIDPRWYRL